LFSVGLIATPPTPNKLIVPPVDVAPLAEVEVVADSVVVAVVLSVVVDAGSTTSIGVSAFVSTVSVVVTGGITERKEFGDDLLEFVDIVDPDLTLVGLYEILNERR
jgi:hypothetical protein